MPSGVVELLRLCVIVFFAGLGFQVASTLGSGRQPLLGPFDSVGVGIILGSGIGYVLGGVLGSQHGQQYVTEKSKKKKKKKKPYCL